MSRGATPRMTPGTEGVANDLVAGVGGAFAETPVLATLRRILSRTAVARGGKRARRTLADAEIPNV